MKLRNYAIIPILALSTCVGIATMSPLTPNDTIYAKEAKDYLFESEDTIVINDYYNMFYGEQPVEEVLRKVKHIILNTTFANFGDFNIFPNVETISMSAAMKEIALNNHADDILTHLTQIQIDEDNPYFQSINGVLYNKLGTKLIYYPMSANPVAEIASGTRIIGNYAFKNVPITSVKLPSSVVLFEQEAFASTKLQEISLPADFRVLSKDAFLNTPIVKILVSPDNQSLCSFDGVLYNRDRNHLYYWPDGKVERNLIFPATLTYLDCDDIKTYDQAKTITIPKDMTTIVHTGNNQLEKVILDSTNTTFRLYDGVLYSSTGQDLRLYPNQNPDTEIELNPSLKRFPMDLFYTENTTKSLILPSDLKEFKGDFKLGQIRLGGFVHLSELTMSNSNDTFVLEDGILYNKEKTNLIWFPIDLTVTDVVIPDSVIFIENDQMAKQNHMETLKVSNNCTLCDEVTWEKYDIDNLPDLCIGMYCSKLREFQMAKEQLYYTVIDGVLFSKNITKLYCYPPAKPDTTYRIPSAVYDAQFGSANPYLETLIVTKNVYLLTERSPWKTSYQGDGLLNFTALKNIQVEEENPNYRSIYGVLYKKYGNFNKLIAYPAAKTDTEFLIDQNLCDIYDTRYLTKNRYLKRIIVDSANENVKMTDKTIYFDYNQYGMTFGELVLVRQ